MRYFGLGMHLKAPSFKLLLLLFLEATANWAKWFSSREGSWVYQPNHRNFLNMFRKGHRLVTSQVPMFKRHAYLIINYKNLYQNCFKTKLSKKFNLDLMEDVSRILRSILNVIRADSWYLLEHRWHTFSSKISPKVSEILSMNNPVWLLSHNPQAWENLKLCKIWVWPLCKQPLASTCLPSQSRQHGSDDLNNRSVRR